MLSTTRPGHLSRLVPLVLLLLPGCKSEAPAASAPVLTAVTPNQGLTTGGLSVTIAGTSLQKASSVQFGTVDATGVTVDADGKQITAVTPAHARGSVAVSVTAAGSTATLSDGFRFLQPASITALDPSSVTVGVAATITLRGEGLVAPVKVTVGEGTSAMSLVAGDGTDKAIPVLVPNTLAIGDYAVSVVNGDQQAASSPVHLTVQPPPAPELTSIDPVQGPTTGGTEVRLHGRNLQAPTAVSFGPNTATVQSVNADGTEVVVVAPAGSRGSADVHIMTANGSSSLAGAYRYQIPVVITGIEPHQVAANVSATVTINGTGMVSPCQARIWDDVNVTDLEILVASETSISARVPALRAKDYKLSVINGDGFSVLAAQPLQVRAGLTVSGIHPRAAFTRESVLVEITGTGLDGVTDVRVGSEACTNVKVLTSKRVSCIALSRSTPGTVDVVVSQGDQARGQLTGAFTFYDGSESAVHVVRVQPPIGRTVGGQSVDVYLTGMVTATPTVTFGGVPATNVVRIDQRHARVTTPAHLMIGLGAVAEYAAVAASVQGSSDSDSQGFLYYVRPTLAKVTPVAGATVGGDVVTLNGTGFSDELLSVHFGGAPATAVHKVSSSQLTCKIPAQPAGSATVTIQNEFESSQDYPSAFQYVEAVRIASMDPPTVSISGGTRVEATGSGFVSGRMALTRLEDSRGITADVLSNTVMRFTVPSRASPGTARFHLVDTGRPGQPFAAGDFDVVYADPTVLKGGVGGGSIRRNISVTVLRSDTRAPVPNAAVFVGSSYKTSAHRGVTDSKGMVVLSGDALTGPVDLTVAASGFENQSRMSLDAAEVTFALQPNAPTAPAAPATGKVTGKILDWALAGLPTGAAHRYKRVAVVYPSQDGFSSTPPNPGTAFVMGEEVCDVSADGVSNPPPTDQFSLTVEAGKDISLFAFIYFFDSQDGTCNPDGTQNPRDQFAATTRPLTMGIRRGVRVEAGQVSAGNDISVFIPIAQAASTTLTGAPAGSHGTALSVDAVIDTGAGTFTLANVLAGQTTVDMGTLSPWLGQQFLPTSLAALNQIGTGVPAPSASFKLVYRALAGEPVKDATNTIVGYSLPLSKVYVRDVQSTTQAVSGWFSFPSSLSPTNTALGVSRQFSWAALSRSADALKVEISRQTGLDGQGNPLLQSAWTVFLPGNATSFELPQLTGSPTGADLGADELFWQMQAFAVFPEDGFGYNAHTNDLYREEHWEAHVVTGRTSFLPVAP